MQASESIDTLRFKHASLEQAIEEERQHPHPDDLRLFRLKREKLQIKDEIFHLWG